MLFIKKTCTTKKYCAKIYASKKEDFMAQAKKKSKVGTIILALVLVLIIAAGIVYLCIPKGEEASKVMQVDINPSCQFVLNDKNCVVSVNCLNDDAQIVLQGTDFVGMTAEEAAQTLVKISTEAGYIQVDKYGNATTAEGETSVNITLSVSTGVDTEKLEQSIVDSVNKYFDDNGIIYGAICSKIEGFESALKQLGVDASDYANKTEAEMLELANKRAKELENIALESRDSFNEKYNALKEKFDVQALEDAITDAQTQIDEVQAKIDEYQAKINEYQDSIKALPDGDLKDKAQAGLDKYNKLLNTAKDKLKELNKQLDEAKKNLKDTMNKLQAELDKTIEQLEKDSEEIYKTAKETLQKKYDEYKAKLDEHKAYFEQNKEQIQDYIKTYREGLEPKAA